MPRCAPSLFLSVGLTFHYLLSKAAKKHLQTMQIPFNSFLCLKFSERLNTTMNGAWYKMVPVKYFMTFSYFSFVTPLGDS